MAYDHKHNEANGWGGADGAGENRSWNCGWEGDDGVPAEVMALRHRQLRNAWCLLTMSLGVPMFAMGDELGRTQGGNNNAYNQDNETSWVDWSRAVRFADLTRFARMLLGLRARHPELSNNESVVRFTEPAAEGRALAWQVGDLLVVANVWWAPIDADVREVADRGPWRRVVDTSLPPPDDIVDAGAGPVIAGGYHVAARTTVILERG